MNLNLYEPDTPLWQKISPDGEKPLAETIGEWKFRSIMHYLNGVYKDKIEGYARRTAEEGSNDTDE